MRRIFHSGEVSRETGFAERCSCDLGGGTFSYEGARAPDNRTMWLLSVHGVEFAAEPDGTPSKVGIITGSKVFINPFQHDPTA